MDVFWLPVTPQVLDLSTGLPPLPYLLLVWQISGASEASISPTPLSGGWRHSTEDWYEAVWRSFSLPTDFASFL